LQINVRDLSESAYTLAWNNFPDGTEMTEEDTDTWLIVYTNVLAELLVKQLELKEEVTLLLIPEEAK
jgi:hypothetical protein